MDDTLHTSDYCFYMYIIESVVLLDMIVHENCMVSDM